MIKHGDLVEIDDCVQLMRHRDNGVFGEFLPYDALDHGVCNVINAKGRGEGQLVLGKLKGLRAEGVGGHDIWCDLANLGR